MKFYFIIDKCSFLITEYFLNLGMCLEDCGVDVNLLVVGEKVPGRLKQIIFSTMNDCYQYVFHCCIKSNVIIMKDDKILEFEKQHGFHTFFYFNRDPYYKTLEVRCKKLLKQGFHIIEYYEGNRLHLLTREPSFSHKIHTIPLLYHKNDSIYNFSKSIPKVYDVGMVYKYKRQLEKSNRREDLTDLFCKIPNLSYKTIKGFGKRRDEEIRKCKIIVNVRSKICNNKIVDNRETLRIDRIISAGCIVVSEPFLEMGRNYNDNFIVFSTYDKIVVTCQEILQDYESTYKTIFDSYDIKNLEGETTKTYEKFLSLQEEQIQKKKKKNFS